MRICVYCASSAQAHPDYREAARTLGALLAQVNCTIVYGGGSVGSMGALADGALSENGEVIGIIPRFMADLEWAIRDSPLWKSSKTCASAASSVGQFRRGDRIARRLRHAGGTVRGDHVEAAGPLLQPDRAAEHARGFYAPLHAFLQSVIEERFMNPEHAAMWQVVERAEDILPAISDAQNGTPTPVTMRWCAINRVTP